MFLLSLPLALAESVGEESETKNLDGELGNTNSATKLFRRRRKYGLGNGVVEGLDRIVQKKGFELWGVPWTMQGIPLIFPSPDSGFNLGLRLQVQNISRQDPHELEVIAQILASDKGRYKHQLLIDSPWTLQSRLRVTARLAYDRDITFGYFGIGNNINIDQARLRDDDPIYQNTRGGPNIGMQFSYRFSKYFRAGPMFNFRWTQVSAPAGSLLLAQRPVGINGGASHHVGFLFAYETLDFEPYPSRGKAHELFLHWHTPWIGSDYTFYRVTYTYRRYVQLHRQLILAHRTLIEGLGGEVPFYELSMVSGSYPSLGIGGDRFFRGYDANRYMDKIRLALGFELRWDPIFFNFSRQDITLGFVPFFDVGRVWSDLTWPMPIDSWHPCAGWGLRAIWNSRLVFRVDVGFQPEGPAFMLNLGNSF